MVKKRKRIVIGLDEEFKRDDRLLPTGSTVLNLALSENPYGGWVKGTIANVVGDTHSGKTVLAWTTFAEMSVDSRFNAYDLRYKDAESAFKMNAEKLFGKKAAKRVKREKQGIILEPTIAQIKRYANKKKKPFVYGMDSLDGLKSKRDYTKPEEQIGKPLIPDKPRILSEELSIISERLERTDSFLMIISQTRKKIGVVFGNPITRTGGDALDFYAYHIMWLAVVSPIMKNGRRVGSNIKIYISKNKETGNESVVYLPILRYYGIDDIGSMIDWMVDERLWKGPSRKDRKKEGKKDKEDPDDGQVEKESKIIKAGADFIDATRQKLISHIEKSGYYDDLRQIVANNWRRLEKKAEEDRIKKYL